MNQKGIVAIGPDNNSVTEVLIRLSRAFVENDPLRLQLYKRSGPTELGVTSAFTFGIYNNSWLTISDWHSCRETLRHWLVTSLGAVASFGDPSAMGLTCLNSSLASDDHYRSIPPESVVKFLEGYFSYFYPSRYFIANKDALRYNGLDRFLAMIGCRIFDDNTYRTRTLKIAFPVSFDDRNSKYTTSSVLVNLLRYPEICFKDGKPLVGNDLLVSISRAMEGHLGLSTNGLNSSPQGDPTFLLWLLLARNGFISFNTMTNSDEATISGPSRLMSLVLYNKGWRSDMVSKIIYGHPETPQDVDTNQIFNNFSAKMDIVFQRSGLTEGASEVYRILKEKFQKIVVAKTVVTKSVENTTSTSTLKPRKRKDTLLA